MVTTLKGKIKIGGKDSNLEKKLEEAGVKVKLPFTATGFSATKIPKIADMSRIIMKDTAAGVKPSVVVGTTPILDTKRDVVATAQPSQSPAVPLPKKPKYTYEELLKLNKKQQIELIYRLATKLNIVTKIPSLENERITLILDLSKGVD